MRVNKVQKIVLIATLTLTVLILFFLSKSQPDNITLPEKSPSVYQLKSNQLELKFVSEPTELKIGETATVKLILTNTNSLKLQNMVYTVKIPDEFEVKQDLVKVLNSPDSFLSGFVFGHDSSNKITAYMINYPSTNTEKLFQNGTELISFNVKAKKDATLGSYNIGFISGSSKDQFINKNNENILGKVTSATITVIESAAEVIEKPTVDLYTPTTYNLKYNLKGKKPAGTGIMLNGEKVVNESDSTTWENNVDLTKLGKNVFEIKTYKGKVQSTTVTVEIFRHGIADIIAKTNNTTGESKVDIDDLAYLVKGYNDFRKVKNQTISASDESEYRLSDMNDTPKGVGDGIIDIDDLAYFVKNWKATYKYE